MCLDRADEEAWRQRCAGVLDQWDLLNLTHTERRLRWHAAAAAGRAAAGSGGSEIGG